MAKTKYNLLKTDEKLCIHSFSNFTAYKNYQIISLKYFSTSGRNSIRNSCNFSMPSSTFVRTWRML